ncbi:MAG TPA: 23S rRNA (adenine(2030)-N(6))-methyltransferase RlmJ [Thioalkalivibrio sp.]|nr:23S rRNA (adenine(2030)-N(6))-methyltransferase RlmJ [Thioalkalivibrio sp.]
MNYRHAFHAGNHADVLKHIVLLALVDALKQKEAPFFALDTHAGRGRYLLGATESRKTGEADAGILKLMGQPTMPEVVERYLRAVEANNPVGALVAYPGSPLLIAQAMRAQDRLAACELQPDEAAALKELFAGDARVAVHARDGYAAMKAMLPPRIGELRYARGLVLVDPPYERAEEYSEAARALIMACRRWPVGVYALWYPLLAAGRYRAMLDAIAEARPGPMLVAELLRCPEDTPAGLNGSGLCIINPPWRLEQALDTLQPWLLEHLAPGQGGACRLRWAIPDA